jgi:hypothetical protein
MCRKIETMVTAVTMVLVLTSCAEKYGLVMCVLNSKACKYWNQFWSSPAAPFWSLGGSLTPRRCLIAVNEGAVPSRFSQVARVCSANPLKRDAH